MFSKFSSYTTRNKDTRVGKVEKSTLWEYSVVIGVKSVKGPVSYFVAAASGVSLVAGIVCGFICSFTSGLDLGGCYLFPP